MGVAAVLGEDQVRLKGPQDFWHDGLEALDEGIVLRERLERQVDRVPVSLPLAPLLDIAGPREEGAPRLVHRDRQDVRVVIEHPLHPVAMVDVGVHVSYFQARVLLLKTRYRDT